MTVLRAESLVNDGTAIVIYGIAVGITVGQQSLGVWPVSWLLALSYGGGVLAGGLVWLLSSHVRRRIEDPTLENIAVLVTPFAAFLLADLLHASGVLAVVVCGLLMSQTAPRITNTALRLALLGRERATLVQLRDEQQIDDIVLRQVQARLDQEEVRLSRSSPVD